jgi:hypothetical protein
VRAELRYRFEGETDYNALLMTVQDGTFRANIPCEPLTSPGKLSFYVLGQDFNNEKVDSYGSVSSPAHYQIVKSTKEPVPSYPGQEPPKRCSELLQGVAAKGQACSATQKCKFGLYCSDGTCDTAPSCETNSDCQSERCEKGYCVMDEVAPVEETEGKPSRWMVGLHGGFDLWLNGGAKGVCNEASLRDGDFYCYNRGERRIYNDTSAKSMRLPMTDSGSGNVASGFTPATIRVLASVDYVLTNHVSVGTRLGWAFGGGPRAVHYNATGNPFKRSKFLPVHAELRGTWWIRSLGKPTGLHPYLHVAAGMAQVDANTEINARLVNSVRRLDAWHRMGPAFAGAGGGVLYHFTQRFGVQLNLNAMLMLPKTGIVLEPSLGGVVTF